jgi:hypothetical protein
MQPKYYVIITEQGLNLLADLQAGATLTLTRVVVGDGEISNNTDPRTLTNLVHPVAQATSTLPIVTDNRLNFEIEYRTDFGMFDDPPYWIAEGYYDTSTGKLSREFQLREYGIYARISSGAEILLYYATIAAKPEPVYPYSVSDIQVKRYPVQIELVNAGIGVATQYDAGAFVTHQEIAELVRHLVILASDEPEEYALWLEDIGDADDDGLILQTSTYSAASSYYTAPLDGSQPEQMDNFTENTATASANDIIAS